jgi:NhaP-type Na+/H+ and K+/H+ antiporter
VTAPSEPTGIMRDMANQHPKIEHRLSNGDVLIIATTKRDPTVDQAFKSTVDKVRESTRARFAEFRRAQEAA